MTNKEELKERFNKEFCYGVLLSASSDLSAGEDIRFKKDYHPDTVFDFFWQEIEQAKRERDEELIEKIKNLDYRDFEKGKQFVTKDEILQIIKHQDE